MQHFHFTFKRRRFDELKGIVEICVNSDQSGFIDSGNTEMEKAADAADMSVLFFSAGANF